MSHDVFISFSSADTDAARKICSALEKSGRVKCWIAYRDIVPSANYAEQLVAAIESCKLLLLILSEDSNKSPQVAREIERAGSKGIPILPLRIENVVLSRSMEYFISSHHWLDAYESAIEDYFSALQSAVESSIQGKEDMYSGTDADTRKGASRPKSKRMLPQLIIGGGLALTLLVVIFLFLRPDQKPSLIEEHTQPSSPVSPEAATVATTTSPQDSLIQELAKRYRENQTTAKPSSDGWTSSSPLTIAFLDISGTGVNDAERDFILNKTSEDLRQGGRYSIVEREIIDKLLEELNLSSSVLADPVTAIRLGSILSAHLIATGSLSHQGEQWLANLRFIETETTAVKCSVSTLIEKGDAGEVVSELSRTINDKLRREYPLQAKITTVAGESAAMNIGMLSGVSPGMVFELLEMNNTPVGLVTVTSVESKLSHIVPADSSASLEKGMRLREQVRE